MIKYKKLELKDFGVKRKERTLKNGCKVVLYEKKNSPLFFEIKFLAGSRFNSKEGLAHFVEHMMVSETKKFKSKDLLSMSLERYGGSFSLSTNSDFISIKAEICDVSDINILMDFLNEIINEPTFSRRSFLMEKRAIINEIEQTNISPQKFFTEKYFSFFYKNSPLERNNLGSVDGVKNINIEDVVGFYKKNITSQNCTIVAGGDIDIEKLIKKIEEKIKFKNNSKNEIIRKELIFSENRESLIVENVVSGQSLIHVGYRVGSVFDFSPELNLIRMVLTVGRASRLNKKLRYEKGLVYSVSSSYDIHSDCGGFFIKTSCSDEKKEEVVKTILAEIEKIKKHGVSAIELSFVKDKIYKSSKKNFQTSEDWVVANSLFESFYKKQRTQIDIINEMMNVSNRDIIKIANKYFLKNKYLLGFYSKK